MYMSHDYLLHKKTLAHIPKFLLDIDCLPLNYNIMVHLINVPINLINAPRRILDVKMMTISHYLDAF